VRIDLHDLSGRGQLLLARTLNALPDAVIARLAGDLEADGQRVDPRLALILKSEERLRTDGEPTVAERRASIARGSRVAAGLLHVPVGSVRDLTVRGGAGVLRARHYAPEAGQGRPLVLFLHGGGWVTGDLDSHDLPCRLLCKHADVHVVAVDYRLAPESPFPAAVEDAVAAYGWALDHAEELGADASRIGVAGDSAGGNLAAVVSQQAVDAGIQRPAAQLLIYPGVDASQARPSKSLFGEGFLLTRAAMDWYVETYAGGTDRHDPRLSPLLAKDLSGLPPTLVETAGLDPLRDEGEDYAAALREAGVPVVLRRARGLVHGFANLGGIHRPSLDETVAMIGAFSALLDSPPR
jgi:acetyl esterase/lipase